MDIYDRFCFCFKSEQMQTIHKHNAIQSIDEEPRPVRRGGGGVRGCDRTPLLEVKTIFFLCVCLL